MHGQVVLLACGQASEWTSGGRDSVVAADTDMPHYIRVKSVYDVICVKARGVNYVDKLNAELFASF